MPQRAVRRRVTPLLLAYGLIAVACLSFTAAAGVLIHRFGGAATPPPTPQATNLPSLVLPPPWNGKARLNVLILGVDDRPWDPTWGPPRSDTVILATLDPKTMTAGAISLPRDLWVNLPGIGERKLTQAYALGEAVYGKGQGPRLVAQVVSNLLHVPIHHYVVVNFRAFITLIDAMHGVKIDVPQRMALDVFTADGRRYDYPLYPGVQVLNGELALAYARNRSVGHDGDFGRMRRQQQVLQGVLQRLKDPRVLAELAFKAPALADQLSDNLRTDISVGDALHLARLAAEVPWRNVRWVVIDQREATATTKWENGVPVYALVPNEGKLLAARDRVFSPPPTPTPVPTLPPATATAVALPPTPTVTAAEALREAPRLLVENGTGVNGLACRTAAFLQAQGFDHIITRNADRHYAHTVLVEYTAKPKTLAFFQQRFAVPPSRVQYRTSTNPPADIVVILGADWAASGQVDGVTCSP